MLTLSVVLGIVHLHALFGEARTDDLPMPILSLNSPYGAILYGESISITCRCQCPLTMHRYYRGNDFFIDLEAPKGQCCTSLNFTAENGYQDSYTCECLHLENGQLKSSKRSDPVQLIFRDKLSEPTIYMEPDSDAVSNGENVAISCKGDIRSKGGRFLLYKDQKGNHVQSRTVSADERIVTFNINTRSEGSGGNYSCRYQIMVAGRSMFSPFSKDVPITEQATENRSLLNIGLGCAAGITVLLVVALTWFLIAKRRQIRRQNIERNAASAGGATSHEDADNTYDTANHPSHPDQNGVYAELRESDHEELNYATLKMAALNQKEAASVTAAESTLYAEVKKK